MTKSTLLDSEIYREDVSRIVELDLEWDHLHNATLIVSGASGMVGSFLIDVLMTRNLTYGMNCTIYGFARNSTTLASRFAGYAGHKNLHLLSIDLSTTPIDAVPVQLTYPTKSFVIHAASNAHPTAYASDPIGTIVTNVQGTRTMLDLAVRTNATRALFTSTVEIYGDNRGGGSDFVNLTLAILIVIH